MSRRAELRWRSVEESGSSDDSPPTTVTLAIASRCVPLGFCLPPEHDANTSADATVERGGSVITVWEAAHPSALLEDWATTSDPAVREPCGVVLWPGAVVAAGELDRLSRMPAISPRPTRAGSEMPSSQGSRGGSKRRRRSKDQMKGGKPDATPANMIQDKTVLILGAGCGVEAQVAARLGARRVIACDVHDAALRLLEYGADGALGEEHCIETARFDLLDERLPEVVVAEGLAIDVVVASDITYDPVLARAVGRHLLALLTRPGQPSPPTVICVDSQRFGGGCDFLPDLNAGLVRAKRPELKMRWEERMVEGVVVSDYLSDESRELTKPCNLLVVVAGEERGSAV